MPCIPRPVRLPEERGSGRWGRCPLPVLDDDPTGTQTVHSVPVLARWTPEELAAALGNKNNKCFFVLSNTRALPSSQAAERAFEIASNLRCDL